MGVEHLSVMLYDDRALVEDMMEHVTVLALQVLEKMAGKGLRIDQTHWWEDMCYNAGSLLSPRMFRQMMLPRYRRINDFLRHEFACDQNMLDSDGNIHQLSGLWLQGGINIMFPIESAHSDPFRLDAELGDAGFLRGAGHRCRI
jgi:uroporphyrinogen decarboxylase